MGPGLIQGSASRRPTGKTPLHFNVPAANYMDENTYISLFLLFNSLTNCCRREVQGKSKPFLITSSSSSSRSFAFQ